MIETVFNFTVLGFLRDVRKYHKAFNAVSSVNKALDAADVALAAAENALAAAENALYSSEKATDVVGDVVRNLDEVVRNSMAYAWEIGKGKPFKFELDASPDNPFLDGNWAAKVNG
jgi:hypothetical protein